MEKDIIFGQRKELKKQAHQVVRSHYWVLVFLTLILIMFADEFSYSKSLLGDTVTAFREDETEKDKDDPGTILDSHSVYDAIINGNLAAGEKESEELSKEIKDSGDTSKTFGRTRGVLADIVNDLSSGRMTIQLGKAVYAVFRSQTAVAIVFVIVSYIFIFLVTVFIKLAYQAVVRRIYLESRVYEKIAPSDLIFFAQVKKYVRACLTMLLTLVFLGLWSLTIIGGAIKYFSYWAVTYIVAENPSVKPREAINLSRRMMYGHKLELLKYYISMIGWYALTLVTLGISDIVYGASYRIACETEFYVKLRQQAIDNKIEGYELLNDRYLYEKADKIKLYETYFDVVDQMTVIHEEKLPLSRAKAIAASWFGIWIGTLKDKKQYENRKARISAIRHYKRCMSGENYPGWLNPGWAWKKELPKRELFYFIRCYSVWTLFLLFILFCVVGWCWEVGLHYAQTGEFANRGTLHGPWLPIYGTGGIIVLILCSKFRSNPVKEFINAVVLCGAIEYFTSWYLETMYNKRWWSYDGYFLNINGRICAEGLIVFGIGCCLVVYLFAPLFDFLISMIKSKILIPICIVIAGIFCSDLVYSSIHPNVAKGAVEAAKLEDENLLERSA